MTTSMYFSPGGINTSVTRQIINKQIQNNNTCTCLPISSNKKVYNVNSINNNGEITNTQIIKNINNKETTTQRIANILKYYPRGKIQYGNPNLSQSTTFLGKMEGQPGGIIGITKIKNKF